jgi:hypothetical protein
VSVVVDTACRTTDCKLASDVYELPPASKDRKFFQVLKAETPARNNVQVHATLINRAGLREAASVPVAPVGCYR